ncbi:unnamed protein product [Paramecium sonneborni]|uniref:Uncharacterized protein n=1 Tax=Paramecium sonneborni TaxID=65129 RepID=A0A8S1PQ92_9CILI|nr:unnamed protein product [Paramecium sonneborni]
MMRKLTRSSNISYLQNEILKLQNQIHYNAQKELFLLIMQNITKAALIILNLRTL